MGLIDRISKNWGLMDSDEEEDTRESYPENKVETKPQEPTVKPAFGAIDPPVAPPIDNFVGHNVVDFNSEMTARKSAIPMSKTKINTIRPKNFDHAQEVANSLRDKIPVIINFEETDPETAKRIFDFISGTVYAINGEIKKVSQNVFVCAPSSVTVTYTEEGKKITGDIPWLTK